MFLPGDYFEAKPNNGNGVVAIGAGISGIMDAFALCQAGFNVSVYAKGPDPRKKVEWDSSHSSTFGGECGRFVTRFEGEHYLGDSPMYPDMKGCFQRHISEGGWLGKFPKDLDEFDKVWLAKRINACGDNEKNNATERFYVESNSIAMKLWQRFILDFPQLFKNTDLRNAGVLRLYDNELLFDWAVKRHKKEGVLKRSLSPLLLASEYPYFAEAVELGYAAGGLEAEGFSFNVHTFVKNLINYLETANVEFHWNEEITRIKFNSSGLVEGLVVAAGEIIRSKFYSINPGAYSNQSLFAGTPVEGRIAGVAGAWLLMPSPKNFLMPVKIHGDVRIEGGKKFPVVDINLTPFSDSSGNEWLAVGGGYAYVGKPPFDYNNLAFSLIESELERTVRMFLGPSYREAQKLGLVKKSERKCIRSFTWDDVPVMENMSTVNSGICRFNAGSNTGTTTIAPFTAQETVKAFLDKLSA